MNPGRLYRISEVAHLLGVKTHVVRYWESRFGVRSSRSPGGRRIYTEAQVRRLIRARDLLKVDGYTIEGAKRRLSDEAADLGRN